MINFPLSPTLNESYTYNGRTWIWNGTGWELQSGTIGPVGPTGPAGPEGPAGPSTVISNIDGGYPNTNYGGITAIDCGGV